MPHILVIDDEERQRQLIATTLGGAGYQVSLASNGEEGMAAFRAQPADLVITDLVMPVKDGVEFMEDLHQDFPAVPVILMTAGGMGAIADTVEALEGLGATRGLIKPFAREHLLATVRAVLTA
jgi:DNA-binding response OmpR family regulator